MAQLFKVPSVMTLQPEGGYTVTNPAIPKLVTERNTLKEALSHVKDALVAVVELYEDLGKPLPTSLRQDPQAEAIWFEYAVTLP